LVIVDSCEATSISHWAAQSLVWELVMAGSRRIYTIHCY